MKLGLNSTMLEHYTCGPDSMSRSSLWYWEDFYRSIAATRFDGMEIVYMPWDFNIGRSGIPYVAQSMKTNYGSIAGYQEHLAEIGIPRISSIHVRASDITADYETRGLDPRGWMNGLKEFFQEAIDTACQLKCDGIVLTPTPEMGFLASTGLFDHGKTGPERMMDELAVLVNQLGSSCTAAGLKLGIRNEFWTMVHGGMIDLFLDNLDSSIVFSPDAAAMYISNVKIKDRLVKYKDRLDFVCLNDTFFEDKENVSMSNSPEYPQSGAQRVYCMVGYGKVNKEEICQTLKDIGYSGWLVCGSRDATNIPKAVLNLRWYLDHVLKV